MSLVTIERSSSSDNLSQTSGEKAESEEDQVDAELSEEVFTRARANSSVEGFFASKGAAFAIPDGDFARKASLKGGELQSHLQGMVNLIRDEDTMRLVVKVESEAKYTRYLSIVTTYGLSDEEESVVLGFDWIEEKVTLGLVIPLWSNITTKLDGDGGFEIKTEHRNYIFKPVSVQTMWTALLWIHKCLKIAHRAKHFNGGLSHTWLAYYQNRISSPRECVNFWESMDEVENKRDICFSYFDKVKTDEELLKGSIRNKLKEILTRYDLEEVTCRQVREALEAEMEMSLQHLKSFVDEQLFLILGQMESSSKITDHLYLGSEWNASNLEELRDNGVCYILNVTKEVDNFFPGTFEYMNIRIYDVKEADLLQHWGKTYRFLHKARERGSAALVHCRRGISRSASTVVAYLMKEENMSLHDAMKFVKSKRSIVQPNSGFWKQLIIYEGILKSSRNRHNSLFRRRSNSDCSNIRKHHKKNRHKNSTGNDSTDGSPDHAHTLPKMSSRVDPVFEDNAKVVANEEEDSTANCNSDEVKSPNEEETLAESMSSEEDSSESDEGSPVRTHKIRRSVSEPAMKKSSDLMGTSPVARKLRARTFVESETKNMRSPTRISEDVENDESDMIWIETNKKEQSKKEDKEKMSNADKKCGVSTMKEDFAGDDLDKLEKDDKVFINLATDNSHDVAEDCKVGTGDELVTAVKDRQVSDNPSDICSSEPSCARPPSEGLFLGDEPRVDSSREEFTKEDDSSTVGTPRARSRSIGEKLLDKLLMKQGKCEGGDNLKKVNVRGRVRRRERKAKSDLQLPNSGFVKRHTQIIEEQMLYSLLMNSEKTPASLATDFWENNTLFLGKRSCCEDNSEKNVELTLEKSSTTANSEKNAEIGNVGAKSEHFAEIDQNKEEKSQICLNNVSEKRLDQCCGGQFEDSKRQNPMQCSEKDVEKKSEISARVLGLASEELQNIVQEVNAEARRDIKTQAGVTQLPLAGQNLARHSDRKDDVCIDEMAWIDLTHHHGDVVKRRSAAFENASLKNDVCAKNPDETVVCPASPDDVKPKGHAQESVVLTDNSREQHIDIPKLDFGELTNDEPSEGFVQSSTIIVEDYNTWVASSVRERTNILENIIAKTGGSFPSPRSRVSQRKLGDFEVEDELEQEMKKVSIEAGSAREYVETKIFSSDVVETSEHSVEKDFGDEPVRSLVDKFEGKTGDCG